MTVNEYRLATKAEFGQHRTHPKVVMGGVTGALLIAPDLHFGPTSVLHLYSDAIPADGNPIPGKAIHSFGER